MNSRKIVLFVTLAIMLMPVQRLCAQVGLMLYVNQSNYLQYEAVYAKVLFRNYSGHTLAFGDNEKLTGSLDFIIETPDKRFAQKRKKEMPPIKGLILRPGETKDVIVKVSDYYKIVELGKYKIKAIVKHSQFASEYESNPVIFKVSKGIKVWEETVGVPNMGDSENKKIASRTYKIVSLFDGKDKVFFMIIEDRDRIYSLKRIGYEMSSIRPECEIDSLSRLHILLKTSPSVYSYFVFDINGQLEEKEVYKKTSTEPRLIRNDDSGGVSVAGGRRARKDVEYKEENDLPFLEKVE